MAKVELRTPSRKTSAGAHATRGTRGAGGGWRSGGRRSPSARCLRPSPGPCRAAAGAACGEGWSRPCASDQGERGSSEPGLDAGMGLEVRPVDELRAAIEGDRAPGPEGQGAQNLRQNLRQPGHDRRRSAIRVRQQHLETAHALDQGSEIAPSEAAPEPDQVVRRACAAPSGATVPPHPSDRTDVDARRRRGGTRCCSRAGTSGPDASGHGAGGAGERPLGQVPPQVLLQALLGVDEPRRVSWQARGRAPSALRRPAICSGVQPALIHRVT